MNRKVFLFLMLIVVIGNVLPWMFHPAIMVNHSMQNGAIKQSSPGSSITCTGNRQSMMIDGLVLFQDAAINFSYVPEGMSSARAFASTSILVQLSNSTFSDARGTGVRYDIEYNNTDARLIEEIRVYPLINAILINASLIPATNFTFSGNEFDLVSCDRSNLLPFMDAANKWLSYFDGLDIWGSFYAKSVKSDNVTFARTPVLLHNTTIGMLVGALTSDRFETEAVLLNSSFAIKTPIVGGYRARNQTSIPLETCWIQLGTNFSRLFLSYAQQVRAFNPPVRTKTVDNFFATSAGTCDWNNRYGLINESTVSTDLDTLISVHDAGYSFYIMDSGWGYDNTTGDDYNWSSWNAQKFPHGVSSLVTKAHDAGIKFVLWNRVGFAPVWVRQNHYWWIGNREPWSGYIVMNLSMHEVQDYIANVFATWEAQGIDGLKIDFIADTVNQYAWDANVWNMDKTRAQLVNQYFDLLDRYASTYNLPVLLCGTPIGYPSLARYPNLVASRVTGDSGYEGVYPDWQVTTALLRSFWWNATFNTPDPDGYKTSDLRSVMVASSIGGALYYGENYPVFNAINARHAKTLHWDAPAVPDNIAYNAKFLIARGTWHHFPAVIALNLDYKDSCQCVVDGLVDGTSVFSMKSPADGIFAGSACSESGISGQYGILVKPRYSAMYIFYQGQPPFPVPSCLEVQIYQIIAGLAIPVGILAISLLVHLRRGISGIRSKRKSLA